MFGLVVRLVMLCSLVTAGGRVDSGANRVFAVIDPARCDVLIGPEEIDGLVLGAEIAFLQMAVRILRRN